MTTQLKHSVQHQWQQNSFSSPFMELSPRQDVPPVSVFLSKGNCQTDALPPQNPFMPNKTYLHSERLKQSLNESRKAFLSFEASSNVEETEDTPETREEKLDSLGCLSLSSEVEQKSRKVPSRKISFKTKRNVGLSRRTSGVSGKNITTYSANTVAQLTLKFNRMVEENKSILDEPKFAKLVKRVNSQRKQQQNQDSLERTSLKVARKPSVKLKPVLVAHESFSNSGKSSAKRKSSVKSIHKIADEDTNSGQVCVRAKITYIDIPQCVQKLEDGFVVKDKTPSPTCAVVLPKSSSGSVRATIERFERQTSREKLNETVDSAPLKVAQKPKVPEKTVTMKTKNLVIKDGVRKFKIYEKRPLSTVKLPGSAMDLSTSNNSSVTSLEVEELNSSIPEIIITNTTTSFVSSTCITSAYSSVKMSRNSSTKSYQTVISIMEEMHDVAPKIPPPKLPSRNTRSVYEPLNYRTAPLPPVLKLAKSEEVLSISDTVSIPAEITAKPNTSFLWRRQTSKDYDLVQSNTSLSSSTTDKSTSYSSLHQAVETFPEKLPQDDDDEETAKNSWEDLYDTVDPTLPPVAASADAFKLEETVEAPPPPRPNAKPLLSTLFKTKTPLNDTAPSNNSIFKQKMPLPLTELSNTSSEFTEEEFEMVDEEKVYEDLNKNDYSEIKYEEVDSAKSDDGYEVCASPCFEEALYETLPSPPRSCEGPSYPPEASEPPDVPRRPTQPLPPRPISFYGSEIASNESQVSNCYESIYNASIIKISASTAEKTSVTETVTSSSANNVVNVVTEESESNNYESIYGVNLGALKKGDRWSVSSNRDSTLSFDQQSNSLYGRSIRGWTPSPNSDGDGRAASDFSSSDKSDDWVDLSDPEDDAKLTGGFVIVRERQKNKKSLGWSKNVRDQFNKTFPGKIQDDPGGFGDDDHLYESLDPSRAQDTLEDDYDSFDSDTESEISYSKAHQNDSGVDMSNSQLPEPPGAANVYGIARLAVSAGKHMQKLRRNWSTTKNDITKSLSRMTKKKSRTDLDNIDNSKNEKSAPLIGPPQFLKPTRPAPVPTIQMTLEAPTSDSSFRSGSSMNSSSPTTYINIQYPLQSPSSVEKGSPAMEKECSSLNKEHEQQQVNSTKNTLSKKKYWPKFRRSMSVSEGGRDVSPNNTQISPQMGQKPKSTFYLTDAIDADTGLNISSGEELKNSASCTTTSTIISNKKQRPASVVPARPQSPPPPAPTVDVTNVKTVVDVKNKSNRKSSSWYSECGLFKNDENALNSSNERNSANSTCWYAEIGLYQSNNSTPCTSSAENSGNALHSANNMENIDLKHPILVASIEDVHNEEYYNLKNGKLHQNSTFHIDWRADSAKSFESTHSGDTLLCLQDEPLYQFYNEAVAVCAAREDGSDSDDYDGYEEIGNQDDSGISMLQTRPSAMQLVLPKNPGAPISRTLWCEIPEVVQSAILNSLNPQQRKIQEAKFEIVTSEASYVNSLNVLQKHFICNKDLCHVVSADERQVLFGKVESVKECSEKLLADLESCWQESILLTGISDVLQRHIDDNFSAYVSYCQNQVLIDHTLKKLKERPPAREMLRQLEKSQSCHSLPLYSFLMLPMQRVTRLPLLVDAVLKRLAPQDDEFVSCQRALATINSVVKQCNEAARKADQEMEIRTIAQQIDFPKTMTPFKIENNHRWLVRSGPLTQLQTRSDETKLTFGKRFNKMQLYLFLFNDLLLITKAKGEDSYTVLHYCSRSFVDLTPTDTLTQLPVKDTQGRHLLFITILENHEKKTVEMLLSCCSESDRVRWQEALSPPVSDNPDETLYEFWDCPQVRVVHPYSPMQPDDLALNSGDVINVTRKLLDGWYYGEKIRDGQTGWFPATYTQEVANPHVRARHLKQRHRFLNFTVLSLGNRK